jgi:hypothetical protein
MLQAQIHHKIPREFEGMEDVLTSSTIGLLSYLPGSLAADMVGELAHIQPKDEAIEVVLWPTNATPPGFRASTHPDDGSADSSEESASVRGRTEPDAILHSAGWLVVLEAKYHSPLDEEYDQLGREFAIGFNEARKNGLQFRLLVLTAHTLEPKPAGVSLVQGVQRAIAKSLGAGAADMIDAIPDSLRWISWQRLYLILCKAAGDPGYPAHTQRLLGDACKVLELHGLAPYDGTGIEKTMLKWQSCGIPENDWAAPLIYRSRTIVFLKTGWEELMSLDASGLGALTWCPYSAATSVKARRRERRSVPLEDFELSLLQPIAWQPYPQKGNALWASMLIA